MQCKCSSSSALSEHCCGLTPNINRFIYNVAVRSGKFDLFRRWMISNTPADKRIMLLIIGYSFGALLEGTYVINLGNISVA